MAHDIQDDAFHEIQLSGKQLVFLFMATTVVSIVIFLCGVLVGRGVPTAQAAAGSTETTASAIDDDRSVATVSSGPTAERDLTYPDRLNKAEPGTERVSAPDPPSRTGPAQDNPPTTPPVPASPAPVSAPPAPATARAAAPAAPAGPVAPTPAKDASNDDDGFTVQVTALKNRPDADSLARRLQGRGYKAYVVAPNAGGQVIYKVRVGMNMQRQEAQTVMRRLQSEEKFKPWITR